MEIISYYIHEFPIVLLKYRMILFRNPLSTDYPQVSSLVSRNPQLLILLRGVSALLTGRAHRLQMGV